MEGTGMKSNEFTIKGIPVAQNQQEFIIGKVKISDLLKFTMYTERVIISFDENELPIYNSHIQRKVEVSRVNKISDFLINDKDATFPTNIVLGVPIEAIKEQKNVNELIEIKLIDRVFEEVEIAKRNDTDSDIYVTIIDGQHRIRGIEQAISILEKGINSNSDDCTALKQKLEDLLEIELVVSFFIDKSLEYQAMIFSTINRTQKRVSQDLVYSLFGLSSNDTPYKTALEVTLALNTHKNSPFYKRIKLYGGNYRKGESPPLSQATMIKNIVALISFSMRESENDKYRKRKELNNDHPTKFLPFRKYYANDHDNLISDCMYYYFNTVRSIFCKDGFYLWDYDGISTPQNILQSTVGFEALLDIMVDILKYEDINSFSRDTFINYLKRAQDIDCSDTNLFPMSTKGKKIFYTSLSISIYPVLPNYINDNRREYLEELKKDLLL